MRLRPLARRADRAALCGSAECLPGDQRLLAPQPQVHAGLRQGLTWSRPCASCRWFNPCCRLTSLW